MKALNALKALKLRMLIYAVHLNFEAAEGVIKVAGRGYCVTMSSNTLKLFSQYLTKTKCESEKRRLKTTLLEY